MLHVWEVVIVSVSASVASYIGRAAVQTVAASFFVKDLLFIDGVTGALGDGL